MMFWLDAIKVLALGAFSGLTLTLMDRIDEHRIITRYRTQLAYLAATAAALSVAWTLECMPILYSLPFCLCLEWIIKNKIDYPSHVFSLFIMAIYFGWRIDLLYLNINYIVAFLLLRLVSGTLLRKKYYSHSGLARWYYDSYFEKYLCNIIFALVLWSPLVLIYSLGVVISCFYTKKWLPEKPLPT